MHRYFKIILSSFLSFLFIGVCRGQEVRLTSDLLKEVAVNWKQDSLSCKGYRMSVAKDILKSKVDFISKNVLISNLGQPNLVQKFYSGITNKNYISYIYYIYKDECPKIGFEGVAIQFVFEELETYVVEISDIHYCG